MTRPYLYQLKGVRQLHRFNGRALLADSMGLGKTLQSLLYIERHPDIRPVIVVCPASLKWNWERECARHVNIRAQVLGGTQPTREQAIIAFKYQIIIINYDILGSWMKILKGLKSQLIILDECQYLASRYTKRTKAVRKLCQGVKHVIALSGTPLINRPAELWPTLNIIRPDLYPSFFSFANTFCSPELKPWGWEFKGAVRLRRLHKELTENLMIRRRKEDVLKELPSKQRSIIPLELESKKEYTNAVDDFLGWLLKRYTPSKANRAAKAERLVQMGYLKRLSAELKMKSVVNWLDNFLSESDGKIIVFGVHKVILESLYKRYQNISVLVTGKIIGRKRQKAIDVFQTSKHHRILFGNIDAAGVGGNMTTASAVAFVELPWAPGKVSQAEDRAHRIGQTKKILVYFLVAKSTIEEDLCEILQRKQATLSKVLDGRGRENDLDIFDMLVERLQMRAK